MHNVWISNVPCEKNLESLSDLYSDYERLKEHLFPFFSKTCLYDVVILNKKILIKPNWVYHYTNDTDNLCLTTHPNFILAVLEYVLILKPNSVIIGDSPIQSCVWQLLHDDSFTLKIEELEKISNIPIRIVDFRNEKWEGRKTLKKNCRTKSDNILFDLKEDSFLDSLSRQNKTFIVGDYDPNVTIKNHSKGIHRYLIAREIFDADIILNLPKLKTHQKAGITNGLKNYVGTVGEKGFLAHHSSNVSNNGGDCFPGNNIFRKAAEYFREKSFKYKSKIPYYFLHYLSSAIWRLAPKSEYANMSGAWYGNDTVWRMVLDINKIITFGNIYGHISTTPQRKTITISDGIISGQGEGPLKPTPNPMGMVSVSDNDMFLDYVMAKLMGFDCEKIPLLTSFAQTFKNYEYRIFIDGKEISEFDLQKYSIKTTPPKGWTGQIESN